jgi:hypothetical protein
MDDSFFVPLIIFGSAVLVILMPIYWRTQERKRVLEAVGEMAKNGAPMSPDLVASLLAPIQQPIPNRLRDIRRGVVLLALALAIAIIGFVAYVIAANTGSGRESIAIGSGVAAVGAIPGCIGAAFLLLGLSQRPEAA